MLHDDIWTQHDARYCVGGARMRFLRYSDMLRIMGAAHLSFEDQQALMRLDAKQRAGDTLSPEEQQRAVIIASKVPTDELRAACVEVPDSVRDGFSLRTWLSSIPPEDRRTVELYLDVLASDQVTGVYGIAEAFGMTGAGIPIDRGLSFTTMTVQQAVVISRTLEGLKHVNDNGGG